jgi:hypothetical protein
VAVGVGKQVHDDEGALSAMDDQICGIIFFFCQRVAKHAPILFNVTFNVILAPGGCHSFHVAILAEKTISSMVE